MLVNIEPLPLDLRCDAQTDQPPDDCANDRASHHRKHNGDSDCFQLLQPERMLHNSRKSILRGGIEGRGSAQRKIWIHTGCREYTGKKCAERSAHSMHAECIERVIVAEPGFQFCAREEWNDSCVYYDDDRARCTHSFASRRATTETSSR